MSELGQSDDSDDRADVWTLSMTVKFARTQIDVIGALADYGAEGLQTDRRGVMVIPAGELRRQSNEFSNAHNMRDNAVLLRCDKKGTRRHTDILTQVRASAKAGARVALVAKPEDSVLIPRLVADQATDISIPVVVVPSSFKDLVGRIYHGEGESLYLHCTGTRQSMSMREYTERARASLVDTSPKDSESDSEQEPEPKRFPAPEPEPEPELATVARAVSWKSPETPSRWAVGFDSMDAAARLYKTTTRPETKVNVLHEKHPDIPKEVLTEALQRTGGQIDAASAAVVEWAGKNPDWNSRMQLGFGGAAVPEAVPHDTAGPVSSGTTAPAQRQVQFRSHVPTEPEPEDGIKTKPVERSHEVAKLRKERSELVEMVKVAESVAEARNKIATDLMHERDKLKEQLARVTRERDSVTRERDALREKVEEMADENQRLQNAGVLSLSRALSFSLSLPLSLPPRPSPPPLLSL